MSERKALAVGLAVLGVAAVVAAALWLTPPTPERRPTEPHQPLVTTTVVNRVDHRIEVELHGRVEPVTRIELIPEVSGRIARVHAHFVPGGRVPARESIVTIDEREYRAAAEVARAQVSNATEELLLERGRRRVALAEWSEFGQVEATAEERDLATRGPQLRMREAELARAEAMLRRAELDLERCRIRFPYPVVIESIDAAVGSVARAGTALGAAYPVRAFWIHAALPVEKLAWFSNGAEARVWPKGADAPRPANILEIAPSVEPQGTLGRLVVEVPLQPEEERLPLRVGEFARLVVTGQLLDGVFVLPRRAVRGDDRVWLVDDDNRLVIRRVVPQFASRDVVVVRDLESGDRVITSPLAQPVAGMPVRVTDTPVTTAAEQPR